MKPAEKLLTWYEKEMKESNGIRCLGLEFKDAEGLYPRKEFDHYNFRMTLRILTGEKEPYHRVGRIFNDRMDMEILEELAEAFKQILIMEMKKRK